MSLVSDCGGIVEQIAFAIPSAFFRTPQTALCRPIIPIGKLMEALPEGVQVIVLVDAIALPAARAWIDRLTLEAHVVLHPLGSSASAISSPWVQDAFHVRAPPPSTDARQTYLAFSGGGPAPHLATAIGASVESLAFHLDGGNHLVGPDFRILGHADIAKIDLMQRLDDRPISIFGYRIADLSPIQASACPTTSASRTKTAQQQIWPDRMHQFGFHLDQFVTLTGLLRHGRPLLVVAQPLSVDRAGESAGPALAMAQRCLDASVCLLEEQGFEVLRNPVAFAITPDTRKRLPRLYNNAIVENDIRDDRKKPLVWLPQFADEEALDDMDQANAGIWKDLGFEVRQVFGWTHLASRSGALRCISKVLARRPAHATVAPSINASFALQI